MSHPATRRHSGGKYTLPASSFAFDKYKDSKKDPKSKSKENVKILLKYNSLDEAFPSFMSVLTDPMAHSYFKSYLHAKVCIENILFYEKIISLREVEHKQTPTQNTQLCTTIFKDFFEPEPNDSGAYVLNVDSTLKRELGDAIKSAPTCTSAVFKNAMDLVLQQMQTEWHPFKQTSQGRALLENLNSNTFLVLPNPDTRDPVTLPDGWDAKDDPVNWGLAVN